MKLVVVGLGYVGLSNAILLAQHNTVYAVDIIQEKIDLINKKQSPIIDKEIEKYLDYVPLDLKATKNIQEACIDAEYVIIATPTDYDSNINSFNTTSIENVIEQVIEINKNISIIIRSTIPIGYTQSLQQKYHKDNLFFVPEFLREGHALYDNLYPSRVIIGSSKENKITNKKAIQFADLLKQGAIKQDIPVLFMNSSEAESVKLFSNTYLAMRIAFFNELDTYSEINKLDSKKIIEGVCLDSRIGSHYNNPSFGYGGYCLPKDTQQLLMNYNNIPNNLITAIVAANKTRKHYIIKKIMKSKSKIIGIYRLIMKSNSDNFRQSSIQDIIKGLINEGASIIIYEPTTSQSFFLGGEVIEDLEEFKKRADLIVANRYHKDLEDVIDKVYTRDLFYRD